MEVLREPGGMTQSSTAGGFEMGEMQKNLAESPLTKYFGLASIRISSMTGASEKNRNFRKEFWQPVNLLFEYSLTRVGSVHRLLDSTKSSVTCLERGLHSFKKRTTPNAKRLADKQLVYRPCKGWKGHYF